jgi:lipoate-protein ligase A
LLRKAEIGRQTLFLWQNDKSVIVGRNQNVWKECHVQAIEELGVQLVRRGSGGGAVYQVSLFLSFCWLTINICIIIMIV